MRSESFLAVFGYIFLGFFIFDFILKVNIYGFRELDFLWFCSIALLILGFGLILKNSMLLNSFLSMALLVQTVLILDYIWFSFFNIELNGTSLYIFQPGIGLLEFISASKHLFMVSFAFYSVFLFSKKDRKSYVFIPVFIILLLALSYAFSPQNKNLNCVFKPCVKFFGGSLSGFSHFVFFAVSMIVVSLLINFILNIILDKFERLKNEKSYRICIFMIFAVLLLISFASIAMASFKYSKIPKYKCDNESDCTNCTVDIKCRYVFSFGKNLALMYTIKNKDSKDYACDVYMKILPKDIEYKKIGENYSIRSKRKYNVQEDVDYPEVDSQIKLKLDCRVL